MKGNPTDSPRGSALALADLLTHPELRSLTWRIDPVGALHGELVADTGTGEAVDHCARVMGGTPARCSIGRGADRRGLAQLTTVWRGIPVTVWVTYPETSVRPLGTLVTLPAGEGAR